MVGLDRHAVGGRAVKHGAAGFHREGAVHVEARLPIGVTGKQIRIAHGVAHHQQRLVAGMDGKGGVTRRVAVGGDGDDAGCHLGAGLEQVHLLGEVLEDAPRVQEITVHGFRHAGHVRVVHPVGPFRLGSENFGIGKNLVAVLVFDAVDVVRMEMRDEDGVDRGRCDADG